MLFIVILLGIVQCSGPLGNLLSSNPELYGSIKLKTFNALKDSSNVITYDSFSKALQKHGKLPIKAEDLFNTDLNGDGDITYAELSQGFDVLLSLKREDWKQISEKIKPKEFYNKVFKSEVIKPQCQQDRKKTTSAMIRCMKGDCDVDFCSAGQNVKLHVANPFITPKDLSTISEASSSLQKRDVGGFLLHLFLTLLQVVAVIGLIVLVIFSFIWYGAIVGAVTIGAAIVITSIVLLFIGIMRSGSKMVKSLK